MDSNSSEHFEGVLRQRCDVIRELLDAQKFQEALEKLDRLDSDFPNQRQVVLLRKLALKGLGKGTISKTGNPSAKPDQWHSAGDWSEDLITRPRESGGNLRALIEPMAWDPAADNAAKTPPSLEGDPGQTKYYVILAALLFLAGYALIRAVAGPTPGTVKTFADIQFVWIPPFRGGLADLSTGRLGTDETATGYWMSRYELTVGQWNQVLSAHQNRPSRSAAIPKTNASGEEVLAFVEQLNLSGKGTFRLPSPREWEWACSAGTRASSFFFGDQPSELPEYGNVGRPRVQEIGQLKPNEWGLYDLYGNAAEMCVERRAEAGDVALTPSENAGKLVWIAKGGQHDSSPEECVTAASKPLDYYTGDDAVGVRLCRDPGSSTEVELEGLQFPADRSLGTLYLIRSLLGYDLRISLGNARGLVAVPQNSRLGLSIGIDGVRDLTPIRSIPADRLIEVTSPTGKLEDDQVGHLATFKSLEYLDLGDNLITDTGFAWFSGLPKLRVLSLNGAKLTGRGLDRLHHERFPVLENLSLASISGIQPSDLPKLYSLNSLRELNLLDTGLKPDDLVELQIRLSYCEIQPTPSEPTDEQRLRLSSKNGSYYMLLQQELRDHDFGDYGHFAEERYVYKGTRPDYKNFQTGYWVYLNPYWYIWQNARGEPESPPRPWEARNVIGGLPKAQRDYEPTLWQPPQEQPEEEWLMLEYENLHPYFRIWLYSLDEPVWLTRVVAFTVQGKEKTIFEGKPAVASGPDPNYGGWVTQLPLHLPTDNNGAPIKFNRIRLDINKSVLGAKGDAPGNVLIDAVALQRPANPGEFGDSATMVWPKGAACSAYFGQELDENYTPPNIPGKKYLAHPYSIKYRGYLRVLDLFEASGYLYDPAGGIAKHE